MKRFIAAALFTVLVPGCASIETQSAAQAAQSGQLEPSELSADFAILQGDEWTGTLSYLDYSNGTREAIAVSVEFDPIAQHSVTYAIKYPGEGQYNSRETYKWMADDRRLNDADIVRRNVTSDGSIEIVTEADGVDDGRAAKIRTTYVLSSRQFVVRKDVKFSGEDAFINRNEYAFSR